MLQYILECISFQLVFLIIYDFFLKKETFFQWNRLYLLGTHVLSLILPWVKIEAFKTEVPTEYFAYPEFLWNMDAAPITVTANESSILNISWQQGVFFLGLLGATLLFGYKMYQLYRLRKNGDVHYFLNFTRIIVTNSNLAFSFFKSIFLGDKVLTKEHESIIKHELVHIQQKHSWDLLFFELLRIVFWFNPLVYVYQSRISELHEFIADAHMAKTNKKEQYQLLLSEVFQTQHISFVNHFFKTSLIKKRIAMLQRSRSKKIWKSKYLLVLPLVVGMLFYTSCEQEIEKKEVKVQTEDLVTLNVLDLNSMTEDEEMEQKELLDKILESKMSKSLVIKDDEGSINIRVVDGEIFSVNVNKPKALNAKNKSQIDENDKVVPFAGIDKVPVFPGCENEKDKIGCFQERIIEHVSKNFRYPEEAQNLEIQGKVAMEFVMDKKGDITNVRVKGPHRLLEEEAARIISLLPKVKPGIHDGKEVDVPFSMPITFKLQ